MSLIERLAAPINTSTRKSKMDVWVATRTPTEQEAIRTAAINPEWGPGALLEVLVAHGAPEIPDSTFRSWRKRVGLQRAPWNEGF